MDCARSLLLPGQCPAPVALSADVNKNEDIVPLLDVQRLIECNAFQSKACNTLIL